MTKAKPKKPPLPPAPRFIAVPFEQKERAKECGAKWHAAAKRWYIPEGMDRAAFVWPDDYVSEEEWQHILAKEEAGRKDFLKKQRQAFFKADAERNKPTRQILGEGNARLNHLLASA